MGCAAIPILVDISFSRLQCANMKVIQEFTSHGTVLIVRMNSEDCCCVLGLSNLLMVHPGQYG